MNLLRAISTVGSFTLLSRIAGFVRDILIARFLGTTMVADAFFVAFRFPNLFRSLFAEGAFSAAFVPLFAGTLETEGHAQARAFAREALSMLLFILVVFVGLVELGMPWIMPVLAPGFSDAPGKMELATAFAHIAFPYLLFISLASLQSGILNSLGKFAAAASAPILFNVTLVTSLLVTATLTGGGDGAGILSAVSSAEGASAPGTDATEAMGYALSWGVFTAGVLQFLWLAFYCWREGFPVRISLPRATPRTLKLLGRALPVAFGSSIYQINLVIGTLLASLVADGAVSYLYYADRVTQLPLGVIGVAVSVALLPLLTRQLKAGHLDSARWSQNRAMEIGLLLTLPAAAALMCIASPIIGALFERGEFSPADTAKTAAAMVAFASGLPAFVLVKILTPSFYAREDTLTPVLIAAGALVANVAMNLVFMQIWGHVGIALATSLASWLNATILCVVLLRRGLFRPDPRLMGKIPRILAATALMAGALWGVGALLAQYGPADSGTARMIHLLVLVGAGGGAYLAGAVLLRATTAAELKDAFRRQALPETKAP
ncbi:murein biosynthesis integral membrane protein MurJ [Phaeovibrio sulfidiphilus]|uniref:Probable lipid II flippase MurJ n=1 Tax=Phaeovibrio sulfidiphilus TaxID=1220600 RepID=A0A8J6YY29_9PROT|nr:murein biosynthesis integral membrane protein MurJ [Phaeovibrio sulfidiphilus]MBE1237797.1 murein biosynthesis integral membrane protein MurJ [Phaeovibrio sulfidiphilus]